METTAPRTRPGRRAPLDPAKLKALREQRLWTPGELGERANVSRTMIDAIEKGRSGASPKTVRALAKALGVDPSALQPDS